MAQIEHTGNAQNAIGLAPAVEPLPTGEGEEREYYNRIGGSCFVDRYGQAHSWNVFGVLRTTSLALQHELDKIANKPGCPVYTGAAPVVDNTEKIPTSELQSQAARAQKQLREQQARQVGG